MTSQQAPETLSETNRKFWDENARTVFNQEWVRVLSEQQTDLLRSNVDWIGIRKQSDDNPVKLLDFACGNGVVSRALFDYFNQIRGVDISQGMVDIYNELARESGFPADRISAVRGDITATGNEGQANELSKSELFDFDAAVISMALHHVSEPELVLSKLVERLRPDGVLVIVDWTMEGPTEHGSHMPHAAHETISRHGFTSNEMQSLLTSAGCKPESIDYRVYHEKSHIPESIVNVKGGVQNRLFIAKGRKPLPV